MLPTVQLKLNRKFSGIQTKLDSLFSLTKNNKLFSVIRALKRLEVGTTALIICHRKWTTHINKLLPWNWKYATKDIALVEKDNFVDTSRGAVSTAFKVRYFLEHKTITLLLPSRESRVIFWLLDDVVINLNEKIFERKRLYPVCQFDSSIVPPTLNTTSTSTSTSTFTSTPPPHL